MWLESLLAVGCGWMLSAFRVYVLSDRTVLNRPAIICQCCSVHFARCVRALASVSRYVCSLFACLQLKEMNHDNVKALVGACVEPEHICYLMQFCSRGTVQVVTCHSQSIDQLINQNVFT